MKQIDLSLYAIIDPERTGGRPMTDLVDQAVAGGITLLQYRDKHGDTRALVDNARALVQRVAASGVPLLINDRVDVALAAGAHGVHVGQDDMVPADARDLLGPDAIIGLTIKKPDHVAAAPVDLIDYACIGGVFQTLSKDNPDAPVGQTGLAELAAALRARAPTLPIGAIAGITADNAADVIGAGIDGVAVISDIFMADDVAGAARRLRQVVDAAKAGRAAS